MDGVVTSDCFSCVASDMVLHRAEASENSCEESPDKRGPNMGVSRSDFMVPILQGLVLTPLKQKRDLLLHKLT